MSACLAGGIGTLELANRMESMRANQAKLETPFGV
jgi:hypothetical protein